MKQGCVGTGDLSRELLELRVRFGEMDNNGNVDGTGKGVEFRTAGENLFADVYREVILLGCMHQLCSFK